MSEEEMFKNLSDKDKKEVLNLMSFMKKFKEQERNKELYATYEEYSEIVKISMQLNDENEKLENELQYYKQKEDKLIEYITQNTLWLDSIDNQVYTMCGYNSDRIAIVEVDDLLRILNEGDKQ